MFSDGPAESAGHSRASRSAATIHPQFRERSAARALSHKSSLTGSTLRFQLAPACRCRLPVPRARQVSDLPTDLSADPLRAPFRGVHAKPDETRLRRDGGHSGQAYAIAAETHWHRSRAAPSPVCPRSHRARSIRFPPSQPLRGAPPRARRYRSNKGCKVQAVVAGSGPRTFVAGLPEKRSKFSSESRKQRDLLEPHGFWPTHDQVHVLDRLPGGTFDQIVERRHDNCAPGDAVFCHPDESHIRAPHVPCLGRFPERQDMHEWLLYVEL